MSTRRGFHWRRDGFTLPEILVAVAMVGVLSAAVLPTVVGQINKSEVSRIEQDLQNVQQAAQAFRADVGQWPSTLDQLVTKITTAGTGMDVGGNSVTFASTEVARWHGPYLSRSTVTAGIETGGGGTIQQTFGFGIPTGGTVNFLTLTLNDLSEADAESVNNDLDGTSEVTWDAEGQVQYSTATNTPLTYYAVPLK